MIETGYSFICSDVYASNFVHERKILWDEIRAVHSAYTMPWIILEDYNGTLAFREHSRDYYTNQTGMC